MLALRYFACEFRGIGRAIYISVRDMIKMKKRRTDIFIGDN
jgi:hypothetical protein